VLLFSSGAYRSDIPLQAVHLIDPPCSFSAQSLIFCDTRPNNFDPVGAGAIRSCAGAGRRGTPLGELLEQPVNASDSGTEIALGSGRRGLRLCPVTQSLG